MKGFRNHQKFLPEHVFSRVVPGIMRGVYLVHFEQGYPGMYKLSDDGAGQSVEGEIVYVKEEFVEEVTTQLDFLEGYVKDETDNLYERETVTIVEKQSKDEVECETYFCLLDDSTGTKVQGNPASWRAFMESNQYVDAAENWATKE